jgi:hypothetical protein
MNSPTDQRMKAALHDLADGPVPVNLADRALSGANRNRKLRYSAGIGLAAALAVAVAIPAMTQNRSPAQAVAAPAISSAQAAPSTILFKPAAASVPLGGECRWAPEQKNVKEVQASDWPDFVSTTVAALPSRQDYLMQSGMSWCAFKDARANAYAVINLGHHREHGSLTLNMFIKATGFPADCAGFKKLPSSDTYAQYKVLFCTDKTATTPLVFGLRILNVVTVGSVYADGRAIVMESIPTGDVPSAITAENLRATVQNSKLHDVIPDVAAPGVE